MSRGVLNFESGDIAKIEYEINKKLRKLYFIMLFIPKVLRFPMNITDSYPNFIISEPTKSA